jgi:hypothetical protein
MRPRRPTGDPRRRGNRAPLDLPAGGRPSRIFTSRWRSGRVGLREGAPLRRQRYWLVPSSDWRRTLGKVRARRGMSLKKSFPGGPGGDDRFLAGGWPGPDRRRLADPVPASAEVSLRWRFRPRYPGAAPGYRSRMAFAKAPVANSQSRPPVLSRPGCFSIGIERGSMFNMRGSTSIGRRL